MSKVYVVTQPQAHGSAKKDWLRVMVGVGPKPESDLSKLVGPYAMPFVHDLGSTAAAEMLHRLIVHRVTKSTGFNRIEMKDSGGAGWLTNPAKVIEIAKDATDDFLEGCPIIEDTGALWKRLRTDVFKTTQVVMGKIAGVSESQISRYESGGQNPDWTALARLRAFAISAGLPWKDEALFDL